MNLLNVPFDLQRFLDAQEPLFTTALRELKSGRKRTHWMWFMFPQLAGLGSSENARHYAISGVAEAKAYLAHPVLGHRLQALCAALLEQPIRDARAIMGSPDDLKLRSSMTLFTSLPEAPNCFQEVLAAFFQNEPDQRTLALLGL